MSLTEMFFATDGTWGEADGLIIVTVDQWSEEDYDAVEAAEETERAAVAHAITVKHGEMSGAYHMFFAADGTWGEADGLVVVDVSNWDEDDWAAIDNAEDSQRAAVAQSRKSQVHNCD